MLLGMRVASWVAVGAMLAVELSGCANPCAPNPCTIRARRTVCEAVEALAVCRCEAGYAEQGDGCASQPTWTCDNQHPGTGRDQAEPDECPPLAKKVLPTGNVSSRSILPAGDEDWFSLSTEPGRAYRFAARGNSSSETLSLEVFDRSGTRLLAADLRGQAAASASFRHPTRSPAVARVRSLLPAGVFDYDAWLEDLGTDDFPNVAAEAGTMDLGTEVRGSLSYAGDEDVLRFRVPAETAVAIAPGQPADPSADLVLTVERDDGAIADATRGLVLASAIEREFTVHVRSQGRAWQGAWTVVTALQGPDDRSDARAFAERVDASGEERTSTFERTFDVDTVRVDQEPGHVYEAGCLETPGSSSPCEVRVHTASGSPIEPGSPASSVVWAAGSSAPAIVSFGSTDSAAVPPVLYTWRVEDLGLDDHPSHQALGPLLTFGVPLSGRLGDLPDVDAFRFVGEGGHVVRATVLSDAVLAGYVRVTLLSEEGLPLTSGNGSIATRLPATGTLGVRVERAGPFPTRAVRYTVQVSDEGPEDHPESWLAGTPLVIGQQVAGELRYGTDADWFAASTAANRLYGIDCTIAPGLECPLEVLDEAGRPLLSRRSTSPREPIRFAPASAGATYVGVLAASTAVPGSFVAGSYLLRMVDLGPEDHAATRLDATPHAADGSSVAGEIVSEQDVDLFRFDATASRIYEIRLAGGSMAQAIVDVQDWAGAGLMNSTGRSAGLRFFPRVGGTHYVQVRGQSGPFPYALVIADLGADDHGDLPSVATPITTGTPATGQVQYEGDVDVLSLPTTPGWVYKLECLTPGSSCSLAVSAGPQQLFGDSGVERAVAQVQAPGSALTLQVSSNDLTAWTVLATELGPDDHGSSAATATGLSVDGPTLSGAVQFQGDRDYFGVAGSLGTIVTVSCTTATLQPCRLLAWKPQGALAAEAVPSATSSQLGFRLDDAGVYSIQVLLDSIDSYTVRAQSTVDDHGDTAASATAFPTLGRTITAKLEHPADLDVFTIDFAAGGLGAHSVMVSGARGTLVSPSGVNLGEFAGTKLLSTVTPGLYRVVVSTTALASPVSYSLTAY